MNKERLERLEALRKIRDQIKLISEQRAIQNSPIIKQEEVTVKKEQENVKRLVYTNKNTPSDRRGFINMSLLLELLLGIALSVGTMTIINTILTEFIK